MTTEVPTVAERVDAGLVLLHEKGPPHWREFIDVEKLDISSPSWCIIGQLNQYAPLEDGCWWTRLAVDEAQLAAPYGLIVYPHQSFTPDTPALYDELTAEWKARLS